MKLIGAGLPRTATLSQKIALETLGFAPCYHMVNVLSDLSLTDSWYEAFEGDADWSQIFAGFEATVDWPGSFFYQELLEAFPDAKVLLSVRDGTAWAQSIADTIWAVLYGDCMMRDLSSGRGRVDPGWHRYIDLVRTMWEKSGLLGSGEGEHGSDLVGMGQAMERFNEEVRRTVPAERLLVWTASEGWGPLCEFLEVPVPDVPFPRVNETKTFVDRIVTSALAVLDDWHAQDTALQGAAREAGQPAV
ncbi:MAG TPA: sulfotransferase [Acidimicrobiales bacterium]|nr:sulfotransferase [Acidimicrobiales bacterium]